MSPFWVVCERHGYLETQFGKLGIAIDEMHKHSYLPHPKNLSNEHTVSVETTQERPLIGLTL